MQQVTSRPWIAAGVAAVGASMVAATPIQPVSLPAVEIPDIQLTAAGDDMLSILDPLGSMVQLFNTTSDNLTGLADSFFEAPAAALQQVAVNQMTNVGTLLNDPASITDVVQGIGGNLQDVFQIATFLGQEFGIDAVSQAILGGSNDAAHSQLVGLLGIAGPALGIDSPIIQLINVAASPATGVLMGVAGPFASPVVPFINPFMELASGGDIATSFEHMINAPLNAVDGFLNGSTLNLDPFASLISQAGILPDGLSLDGLSLAFGGLLSPGETVDGAGGSLLNSLGLNILGLDIEGQGVGPLGAITGLSQMIAGTLGWEGAGNPLTDLAFPTLDFGDMLGGALGDFNLADMLPTEMLGNLGSLGDAFGFLMGIPEMLLGMLTSAF